MLPLEEQESAAQTLNVLKYRRVEGPHCQFLWTQKESTHVPLQGILHTQQTTEETISFLVCLLSAYCADSCMMQAEL